MTELFMKLLNMSINAGWLVLAVLLVRIMFHKAPKWLFPLLWSFVWIRLLMPNALESRLSVIPDISGFSASEQGLLSAKGFTAPVPYVGIVWCTGMAAMLLFEALSYVHLPSKESTSASKVPPPFRTDSMMAAPAKRGIAAGTAVSKNRSP